MGKRKGLDKSMQVERRRLFFFFFFFSLSLSLSLSSFPHLLQVPRRAGHDVAVHGRIHRRLELVLVLFVGGVRVGEGEGEVEHRSTHFSHRVGLVFFSTLAFLSLSLSLSRARARDLSDRASAPCDP